ncbi:MAG: PspC domain-containing protein [Coprobacillaceae bacterium]
MKRLYRSRDDNMISGVCGGIANYFDVDPSLVRIAWILFCGLGGSGVLAYIIATIVIPYD